MEYVKIGHLHNIKMAFIKKVLVVSSVQSPPIQAGNQKCIYEYCELLKSIGLDVYFLYVEGRKKADKPLKAYWRDKLFVYRQNFIFDIPKLAFIRLRKAVIGYNHVDDLYPIGLTRYVDKLQNKFCFDYIIINYLTLSKLFTSNLRCKKILYAHDCLSFKKLRLGVKHFWIDLSPNQEAKGLQRSDVILSIQENESTYFKYLHPKGEVITVYSNFNVNQQTITSNKKILFLSGKSVLNVNGINYFLTKVFPLVLEKEPDAELIIGGSICDVLPENDNPNVKIVGPVTSEDTFYRMGDIAINPIYQGTGLKIKTFEALSYGKVTIVHPHSAEGIYKPHEAPILVGSTPQDFAMHLVKALSDIEMRKVYSHKSITYIQTLNQFIKQQYRKILL